MKNLMQHKVVHYQKHKFQNSQQELLKESIFPFLLIGNVFTCLYSLVKPNISILPCVFYFFKNKIINNCDLVGLVRKESRDPVLSSFLLSL